ncbi:MAG TPA: PRC-barrel domain-containing protein [candidate division Zixibacteria bacterium]|nr:PRC-barrel domain-containing protein [candidate division Zixibacteria bacterium]
MLRTIKEIHGYNVLATDGEFGIVSDIFFDDDLWTVRYLVVDTGDWHSGDNVLIPTSVLEPPDWAASVFPVKLTKKQVQSSPSIDTNEPVYRQQEIALHKHFKWQPYWAVDGLEGPVPGMYDPALYGPDDDRPHEDAGPLGDPHLRSSKEVIGYYIHATDGEIGHVDDFIVDDKTWRLRYMVADTRNWIPGRKVLIALPLIKEVKWEDSEVHIDVTRAKVEKSPGYESLKSLHREYEEELYKYYGRPGYWLKPAVK